MVFNYPLRKPQDRKSALSINMNLALSFPAFLHRKNVTAYMSFSFVICLLLWANGNTLLIFLSFSCFPTLKKRDERDHARIQENIPLEDLFKYIPDSSKKDFFQIRKFRDDFRSQVFLVLERNAKKLHCWWTICSGQKYFPCTYTKNICYFWSNIGLYNRRSGHFMLSIFMFCYVAGIVRSVASIFSLLLVRWEDW